MVPIQKNDLFNKFVYYLPALVVCILAFLYAAFMANKSMPISEGWYTEYAWQLNNGNTPYSDFGFLFPPAYLWIISWITNTFGYDIIVLRYVGVLVFTAIALVAYLIFKLVFNRPAGMIAALAVVFFGQSGNGEIFYDYIYFFDLFLYFAIYCFLKSWVIIAQGEKNGRVSLFCIYSLICGACAMTACLMKQSTGLLMFIFFVCAYIGFAACTKTLKQLPRLLCLYITGAGVLLIVLAVWLFATDSWSEFLQSCFGGASAAKGGVISLLFAWLINGKSMFISAIPLALVVLLLYLCLLLSQKNEHCIQERCLTASQRIMLPLVVMVGGIFVMVLCYEWETFARVWVENSNILPYLYAFFWVPTILFLVLVFKAISRSLKGREVPLQEYLLLGLCGSAFMIAWGVGMSGGLAQSQVALGAGISFALPIYAAAKIHYEPKVIACATAALFLLMTGCVGIRFTSMYDWWHLSEGSIWQQTESADVPLLQGLLMTKKDAVCYEGVFSLTQQYCQVGDTIFTFPHCPIFYCIAGYHSETYTKVQWFDVSSAASLEKDEEGLKANPPKMLILCEIPEAVISGHEKAFGTTQTRKMQDFLTQFAKENYDFRGEYDLGNEFVVRVYSLV